MWKCPICNNEEKSEYICQKCGHDFRCDFVRSRTIQLVPVSDIQDYRRRILEYNKVEQERKAETNRNVLDERCRQEIELKAKTLYEKLLSEANIDEKTLSLVEKTHLLECCKSSRTMAENYITNIRHIRLMDEHKKRIANSENITQTQRREYGEKKTPKIFRFVAVFILLGIIGVVGAFLSGELGNDLGTSSSYENMDAYFQLKEQWDMVLHTSKEALYKDIISYETDSLENIEAYWESWGYDAHVDPTFYDEEDKYYSQTVYGSYNSTYFNCTDTEAEDYRSRSLIFSYHGEELSKNSMNAISPLPFDIQYGDSYDMVFEKLGLTEEMVSYGLNPTEYENEIIVNLFMSEPGTDLPSISCYFENYYFSYYFNEETYELESYYVDFYNIW